MLVGVICQRSTAHYLTGDSAGLATAAFLACSFFAFVGVEAAATGAGAATGVTDVGAGVATLGAAGVCAKDKAVTPVITAAAIRVLIFNMV